MWRHHLPAWLTDPRTRIATAAVLCGLGAFAALRMPFGGAYVLAGVVWAVGQVLILPAVAEVRRAR